ncbi:MAG: hypothetical protein ABIK62_07985 [candidate division WOR-3 bacterium]
MNVQHRNLAAGRWQQMGFLEQMANIGSEVERAMHWRRQENPDYAEKALVRALELLGLTIADLKNRRRLKELLRVREALLDYFFADNQFGSSDELWHNYFYAFACAARRARA